MENLYETSTEAEIKEGEVVETKKPVSEKSTGEKGPRIRKGKVDSLTIYEISEGELETIERGSPNSTFLNFAIFLISSALSLFAAIVTADFTGKDTLFYIFLNIIIVGFIVGFILLLLWWRTKNDVDIVIKKIKERVKE